MLDWDIDPSQNYLEKPPHPLRPFFNPESVAIIGAKEEEGSVGRTVLSNMIASFQGKIFPVNPKYPMVLGKKAYPRAQDIPEKVDLAVIVTPPKIIPDLIDDCAKAKIKAVIIISAGFKETGPEGLALEEEVLRRARAGGIRIIGPNCLGLMNPHLGLNATFAAGIALKGNTAFLSQSGALCTAVLDWSLKEKIGFSAFVSVGSMSDVQWGDLIDYFGNDPHTRSILMYMETIGNARAFLSAAREVVLTKPIILIKPGRSQAAAKAAASHTGSLAGADDIFEAAIRRVGVLRVDMIEELFNVAEVLGKQPRPKGPRLAIVTNAGGPAVLATDATMIHGGQMATLEKKTLEELSTFLPSAWSHGNPVDILGDAGSERYAKAIKVVLQDAHVDGVLVILTPQDMTDSDGTAKALAASAGQSTKPILASWMGAAHVEEGIQILNQASIPTFSFPDSACNTFAMMAKQSAYLKLLYETPTLRDEPNSEDVKRDREVSAFFSSLRESNRTLLTEEESKKVLLSYGIPVVETFVAETADLAVTWAERVGYPVVLKLHSETITHKTDVGGVKLNLHSKQEVATAFHEIASSVERIVGKSHFQGVSVQKMIQLKGYELIIGSLVDPQFGPVVLFGSGGELVEVYKDKAIGIPPLNATLVKHMMQRTKIFEALQGVRGKKAIDLQKLEGILIRFSRLLIEHPRIKECDINPLIASPDGMIALDARIVLHDFSIPDAELPRAAIRPYPSEYISQITLKNGAAVVLRPIRPEDEPLMVAFHKELSDETVRQRYFGFMALEQRIAHERLIRICHADYDLEISIVAEIPSEKRIVGTLRIEKLYGTAKSELKMVIIDKFQNVGLGKKMIEQSLSIADKEGIESVQMHILHENHAMLHLCKQFNFTLHPLEHNPKIITAEKSF